MNVAEIKAAAAEFDAQVDAEDERQNGWGGKRKGAGRKPIDEGKRMVKRGPTYMTQDQAVWIDRMGAKLGVNYSQLLRILIQKAMDNER